MDFYGGGIHFDGVASWGPQTWAKWGKWRGALAHPTWKCCNAFLCISSYSKMLSRRIIYALLLFSQPGVGFWGRVHPFTPLRDIRPRPLICPPLEKSCGAHVWRRGSLQTYVKSTSSLISRSQHVFDRQFFLHPLCIACLFVYHVRL